MRIAAPAFLLTAGSHWAACLLVAAACSSAAPAPPKPEQSIRFVAYNLHNYRLAPAGDGATHAKSEREIVALLEMLKHLNPEVLGVCEMGAESDLADLQKRLRTAGVDLPHTEWVQAADSVRHLALLSRFEIISRQSVRDVRYIMDDQIFPVQRGFLDVTVQVNPHYQLRLVGAHLKSQRDVAEGDQSLMRRNEAHLLRGHLDRILTARPNENLEVYGDFNETKEQPGHREIYGQP